MTSVFVGIGSNEGDRAAHLSLAVAALNASEGIRVLQIAPIIETEPVGGPPQGRFLNTVVEVETALPPLRLLERLQQLERQLGRSPSAVRWGPRAIDLDILLYGDRIIQEPALTVPHPRMHQRRFVLEPLAQLAPDLAHPVLTLSIAKLLEALDAATEVPS